VKAQKLVQTLAFLVFALACEMTGQCKVGHEGADCMPGAFCYGGKDAKAGDNGVCTLASAVEVAISSFEPLEAAHGATLTIRGINFSAVPLENSVTFNGIPATLVSAMPDEIKVIVPPNTLCSGPIYVTVDGKTARSSIPFTYVPTAVTVSTLAGDGGASVLSGPCNTAIDAEGNLYVTDFGLHRIRKITPQGVSTFAGHSTLPGHEDAAAERAQFEAPWGIVTDAEDNFYVTDGQAENGRIRKISKQGEVSTLAIGTQGFVTNPAPENIERFNNPRGIVRDADGNFYVVDTNNHRIRKISPEGHVSTLAGNGTPGFADGEAALAQFHFPRGIAMDTEGNLYVADRDNHCIRKISPAGVVSTLADGMQGFVINPEHAMPFSFPHGVAMEKTGILYVASIGDHLIHQIMPSGKVYLFAGNGTPGFVDGEAALAQFYSPRGIALDTEGNLYVADFENNRIRKITIK